MRKTLTPKEEIGSGFVSGNSVSNDIFCVADKIDSENEYLPGIFLET